MSFVCTETGNYIDGRNTKITSEKFKPFAKPLRIPDLEINAGNVFMIKISYQIYNYPISEKELKDAGEDGLIAVREFERCNNPWAGGGYHPEGEYIFNHFSVNVEVLEKSAGQQIKKYGLKPTGELME